jgi:hypothetical protein
LKINPILHKKLLAEVEEAKDQHMTKLASALGGAIGPIPDDEQNIYTISQVRNDVYDGMWKLATTLLKYHNLTSLPTERLDDVLADLSIEFIEQVESVIDRQNQVGPFEPKLPGQE